MREARQVAITSTGHLRFRKHDLKYNNNAFYLRYSDSPAVDNCVIAKRIDEQTYCFSDGSTVTHHPDGMYTLQSADPSVSTVYMPALVDKWVGAATSEAFAGHEFYRMSTRIDVEIINLSGEEDKLIQLLNQSLKNTNLQQIEEMVKNRLLQLSDEEVLTALENASLNISYRVTRRESQQRKITTEVFYKSYIEPFITHILKNATDA